MIRRRFFRVWFFTALALVLVDCTHEDAGPRVVATDLKEYISSLQKWDPQEKAVFRALSEVEQSQYVDDDFVVRTLKAALPDVEHHLREISEYRPKTRELSEVHDDYRRGWEDLKGSLDALISAVEIKDYVALAKAKSQMQAARARLLHAFRTLDALLQDHEQELEALKKS